jgi:pyruvate ferredoxin oxidoreductase gamma subunit
MIRVRFHGRGGQGMKTASRILGTAAALDGWEAQDAPVYGAERRGAPMVAFVRLARAPIHERGPIPAPDLVVVADDTLLDDPAAAPLAGLPPGGGLLLATTRGADAARRHTGHPGPLVAGDFVAAALATVGTAAAVSTALAAAAAVLVGLGEAAADRAIETELAALGPLAPPLGPSLRLAARARTGLAPLPRPEPPGAPPPPAPVIEVAYAPPEIGAPTIVAGPNTPLRGTGSWRVFRPVIALAGCTRCWVCFVRCPEGAIALDAEDWPRVDYAVCKGCLICVEECPTHTIARVRETRAWAETEARP